METLVQVAPANIEATAAGTRRFHAMIKPVGSICNLDCSYCFYLHKEQLLGSDSKFQMSDEILEMHIRQYIEGQTGPHVVFSWQGGEPTLRGIPFFEKVAALQRRYKRPGQSIENDLQTNGTLLTEDWARFLKRNNYLVGLSIDGPAELHDAYRVTKDGKPTFQKAFAAVELLHKHQVPFNSLTVVNRINAKRPLDVYRFLRREVRPRQMQFIPCVEPKVFRTVAPQKWLTSQMPKLGSSGARPGTQDSVVTDWSINPDDWGVFLCKVWDEWYNRDYGKAFVDLFEDAVKRWMGYPSALCVFGQFCGKALAIEHDGSGYSCDHYVYPEYKLGNINEALESAMAFSREQERFGLDKFNSLPLYCRNCTYLSVCNGECPKNRFIRTPVGQPGLNYLCSGLMMFWKHVDPCMGQVIKRVNTRSNAPVRD